MAIEMRENLWCALLQDEVVANAVSGESNVGESSLLISYKAISKLRREQKGESVKMSFDGTGLTKRLDRSLVCLDSRLGASLLISRLSSI